MLQSLELRNFQSIYEAKIDLGKLTVIVGPSSSGKSAMLRALKILAGNTTSPVAYVSHGKKALYVRAGFENKFVAVERGKSLSTYTVYDEADGEQKYAKAGTSVPEPIAEFLRFPEIEGFSLNFTSQFDKPFLLDAPATQVAKVLGDLTRINVVYDAVREANRRRLADQAKLKTRQEDLATIQSKVAEYADIPREKERLKEARGLWEYAINSQGQIRKLEDLIGKMNVIEVHIAQIEKTPVAEPIDWKPVNDAVSQVTQLKLLVKSFDTYLLAFKQASSEITLLEEEVSTLHRQHHDLLVEAGVCPVCGQSTEALDELASTV